MKTEFGSELEDTITAWDKALEAQWFHGYDSEEYKRGMQSALWCQAQWEVYKLALKQFYGVEYCFSRTDEYYGLCTEDESDWLMRVDRELASCSKPVPDQEINMDRVVDGLNRSARKETAKITYHASPQELGQALRNLRCQHS